MSLTIMSSFGRVGVCESCGDQVGLKGKDGVVMEVRQDSRLVIIVLCARCADQMSVEAHK